MKRTGLRWTVRIILWVFWILVAFTIGSVILQGVRESTLAEYGHRLSAQPQRLMEPGRASAVSDMLPSHAQFEIGNAFRLFFQQGADPRRAASAAVAVGIQLSIVWVLVEIGLFLGVWAVAFISRKPLVPSVPRGLESSQETRKGKSHGVALALSLLGSVIVAYMLSTLMGLAAMIIASAVVIDGKTVPTD